MNKVITINLNGRAYQLEESGYDALRAYLDDASTKLESDPGKTEIIADLEQAIAEKCDKVLSPNKTVMLTDEIKRIIAEMGPVEGGAKGEPTGQAAGGAHHKRAPHRFYLLREGAVFAGVCAGLAAYFDIDVTIIRILFVALTVFTGGGWVLLYLALALFVPYADTAEAQAQARGEPFNAESLVQRAKERWGESYERVTGEKWDDMMQGAAAGMNASHEQHRKWREERRRRKKQWKQQWKAQKYQWHRPSPAFGLLRGLLAVAWIMAFISLVSTGAIFGWMIPGVPLWIAVIILFVSYFAVTGPLKGAQYAGWSGDHNYQWAYTEWDGLVDGITILFLIIAFVWAYAQVPLFYNFVHHPIGDGIRPLVAWLKSL